jgi:hypothetical protein
MVQLKILTGKKAGATYVARRFPVRVGRGANTDLQFEEDGVWDQHLTLQFSSGEGFVLAPEGEALVRVNGQPVERTLLRNGDAIELGGLRLQFWLGDPPRHSVRLRETLTWFVIGAVTLGQVALIYWLLSAER